MTNHAYPTPTLSAARPNRLKHLLADGKTGVGCLLSYDAPWLVEVLGMTGYDFITIDLEHEPMDASAVATLVRTADLVGMTSIVRMPASEAIFPFLSAGAQAVQIPDLRGREHAEQIVELTRFPPRGRRTYYTQTRAAQYGVGIDEPEWIRRADEELLVIAMIEHIDLLDELDELLAVEGIDAFHIGTLDLAQSMGSPPQERIDEVVDEIVSRCRAAGRYAAVGVVTPWGLDAVGKRVAQGVQILNVPSAWMLTHAIGSFLEQVEQRIPDGLRTPTARLPTPNKYIDPRQQR
jgi:2-keto-3-deoxy-L-rhamnonate aldolase RhmA